MREYSAKAMVTRERILEAANELFYAGGFNATGVDRIIAAAGVTKGNFFYHFKNKEELATAVLDWHRDLALAELDVANLVSQPAAGEALMTLLRRMAKRMLGGELCPVRGCFFGNFALELAVGSEPVRRKVLEIFDHFRSLLRQLIERAQAAGEVRSELDPERTAGLILGLMEGAVLLDKASQAPREVNSAIDFIASYLGL